MLPRFKKNLLIASISMGVIALLFMIAFLKNDIPLLTNQQLTTLCEKKLINKATIRQDFIYIYTSDKTYKILKDIADLKLLQQYITIDKEENIDLFDSFLKGLIAILLIVFIIALIRSRKTSTDLAKTPLDTDTHSTFSMTNDSKIRFCDVAGIDEVKNELNEIVDFLKNPQKYRDFGITLPKGVLLVGSPGVGKTLIAKALAGEAGVPFLYQSGASFVQMYVGVGAKRVRELFACAKKNAPSIIFIDEIDAVGKARGGMRNDEREATLNQLLTEMDGFEDAMGVIVIAATNKIEMLDEALLRSGRFDRRVFVSLPGLQERADILSVHLKGKPSFVDPLAIAKMTVGFSGSALANLVNEAALYAMKRGAIRIEQDDFLHVHDKVAYGTKKALIFNEKEKEVMAHYQAAKALFAYWFGFEFERVGLLGGSYKEFDKALTSQTELMNKIKLHLAGFVACEMIFNEHYTIASNDIEEAQRLAKEMIEIYGMGQTLLADISQISLLLENAKREIKETLSLSKTPLINLSHTILEHESVEYATVQKIVNEIF